MKLKGYETDNIVITDLLNVFQLNIVDSLKFIRKLKVSEDILWVKCAKLSVAYTRLLTFL